LQQVIEEQVAWPRRHSESGEVVGGPGQFQNTPPKSAKASSCSYGARDSSGAGARLACRWNCKSAQLFAEINGQPKLMCMTRMSTLPADSL
jgi:hypothetical protein